MKYLVKYSILLFTLFANVAQAQYVEDSKKPNGMYVFAHQLDDIFPHNNFRYLYGGVGDAVGFAPETKQTESLIIIADNYKIDDDDLDAMIRYLHQGNDVLILANDVSKNFTERLGISIVTDEQIFSSKLSVKAGEGNRVEASSNVTNITNGFIDITTSVGITELGTAAGFTNFVKKKIRNGNLYVHLNVPIVTNQFLIEKGKTNYKYTETVLSYLNSKSKAVAIAIDKSAIRVNYFKSNRPNQAPKQRKSENNKSTNESDEGEKTFMDFVNKQPNLKAAMWVAILAFLLAIIFATKRIQRQIPIEKPVQNHTLDFAQTIGDLYYNVRSNDDIARKKIIYWQEFVRVKYGLPTNKLDEGFWNQLTKKSGCSEAMATDLSNSINQVKMAKSVSDFALVQLCNNIDKFYKV